jgi:hypothetical protein
MNKRRSGGVESRLREQFYKEAKQGPCKDSAQAC